MNSALFYQDKPVFGLDIGYASLKVMQLTNRHGHEVVTGYGVTTFDSAVIKDGVIINHEAIAQNVLELFQKNLNGDITTRRVVISIPAARTFTRSLNLPLLGKKDLVEALRLETEQYIPIPVDDLYVDYAVVEKK